MHSSSGLLLPLSSSPARSGLSARSVKPPHPRFGSRGVLSALAWCIVALGLAAASARAQVAVHTFEGGATHGWQPRGAVTVTSSTDVARTGSSSLKTTGRTANWQGPSLNLASITLPNTTYRVTGWVRLVSGEPASALQFTVERTTNGETSYTQISAAPSVTDGAWVQLQGNFSYPAGSTTKLDLYLESNSATSAYYLDDFTIELVPSFNCPEPLDQSGLAADFESGSTQGWTGRGSATVALANVPHTGNFSLSVTGRTASWNGASINALCKLHKGSTYLIRLYVRLLPLEPASQVRVSLQAGLNGASSFHTVIGNTNVTDGAWVKLETEYTYALDADQLQLYVETASGAASFYLDDIVVQYVPPKEIERDLPDLHAALADVFPVGTAIEATETTGAHAELLLKHFNMVVAGNAMKWDALRPNAATYNFGRADTIANFARNHGLRMRGHTLLWHSQTPNWVFQDENGQPLTNSPAHQALLLQRLQSHIETVVTRYNDIVDAWDVVNEVIDASQPDGLRRSPWYNILGPGYIAKAFEYAAAVARPDALLCINDYSTTDAAKRAALYHVVQNLLSQGLKVDSVGHQMHINIAWPPLADIRQTFELFAGLGVINEVTEMDMSAYTNNSDTSPVTEQTLIVQGYRYRDIFNLYRELKDLISSVTLWGLADDNTWLKTFPITRDDKPLLFDEDLQAKHAYWGVVDPMMLPIIPKDLRITQGSITLTGATDKIIAALAPVPLETISEAGSWANLRTVWNDGALHVVVDVMDATADAGDKVEIFMDEGNEKAGAYDANDHAHVYRGFGRRNGAMKTEIPGGYRLQAIVPVQRSLAVGDQVGFDVRVTDASTGRVLSWSDTTHEQDGETTRLGTLQLSPAKYLAEIRYGRPTIDAIEDKVWKNTAEIRTNRFVLGASGATARVKLLWDETHLYVLATVTDPVLRQESPNVWEEDSIEIFIDQNNGQTRTYQSDDSQYRINYENARSFGGAATAGKITSATRLINGGYVVEAAIQIDQAPLHAGRFLGFDLQVNDAGDAAPWARNSVATWNDSEGNAFQDPSLFGAIRLLSAGQ